MAYAEPSDLIQRKDPRTVGDLAGDGTRVVVPDLLTDPNVLTALQDASDDVDSACLAAGRYYPTDLSGLTGSGANLLKRLVCILAFTRLRWRKAPKEDDADEPAEYVEAMETIERLRKGELIFGGVQGVIDDAQAIVDPLTYVIQSRQQLPSTVAWPMFPSRRYPY